MAIWQFLKGKNNYNTADRKTLILFNIPSVAKTKRVRHCLMTHPSYYNLVYSLAGNSLLILSSFIISPQNSCLLPSCNPSHLRVGRTSLKLRRDVADCTSGRIHYYIGTYQMLRRDEISSTSSVKIAKKRLKTPSIEPGKRSFCSMLSYF
mgnify:CR=1 FL=1